MNANTKNKRTAGKKTITAFMFPVILSFLIAPGAQAANFECINSTPTANDTKSCGAHGSHHDSTHNYFDDYSWCYCKGEGCTLGSTAKPWGFCGKKRDQATASYNQWLDFNKYVCQCKQDGTARGYCGKHGEQSRTYNSKKWCYVKDTAQCLMYKNELPQRGVDWSFCHDDMTIDNKTNWRY